MISQDKRDKIYNALLIGMALEDAYIYAGLTEAEIVAVNDDTSLQLEWKQLTKAFEFDLLSRMGEISQKQVRMGKEGATTWMLEKLFPRYSGKPQGDVGTININITSQPDDDDCVEIHNPS
jgi:hypothetical protein